jgi:hypothetical protein
MTTIAYDRPVKDLIDELNATKHVTHTSYVKKSVTLHHNGGRLSHEGVLNVWKVRPASAHFDVDRAGAVCQYVKVNEFAWAAGSTVGNRESIHIEMANTTTAPNWDVSEVTWKAAARLAGWLFAKVIKARPSASNFFVHSHWKATLCAGPDIKSVWSQIMAEATKWYNYFIAPPKPATPSKPAPAKPAPLPALKPYTYTGDKRVDVDQVRPNKKNEAVRRFNGLLWHWLVRNNPEYARANQSAWNKEAANFYGPQAQKATKQMYHLLHQKRPRDFDEVTLPTWPGRDAVTAIGGRPI